MAEGSERRRTEVPEVTPPEFSPPEFSPPEFSPPEFSETAPVAIGTGIWALLFVIGLVIRPSLVDSGRGWWIWSAAAGVVLGLFGYWFMLRRRAHRPAGAARPEPAAEPENT